MIPRIYGPAHRRSGTKYIDTASGACRVVPFIYSSTIAYILLFENQQMFFYYDGGRVLDGVGQRLKVATPYLSTDLFEIQYKQSNDVMWLVHGEYEQRKLTRTTANSFDLSAITFANGPFIKRNDLRVGDGITLTPSVTTGSGTLTASSATFDSGHVGSLFAVTQPRVNTEVDGTMTNPATGVIGSAILVEGAFTFVTHGVWTGTVKLERSIDQSNWETYRTWTSENADQQVQYTGDESENDIYYRINVTAMSANTGAYSSQTSKIRATLTVNSSTQTGICRITAFSSSTSVSMTVLKDFASTNADVRWAEGCWSTYRGFPRTVTFFENRCIYAGTDFQPQTIWFSATDDYENFSECTKDDSAFSLTLSADTRNSIKWISALEALLVGTTGGEWRVRSSSFDEPLTPTNFSAKIQTTYGSAPMQAMAVNDVILFVDFVRRKVRECTYSPNKDKFVSHDMNSLAEHITESGIVDIDFQKNPDPILWCVRTDGTLLSMTYERDQNVIGWARHPFYGGDATAAATPAIPGSSDTHKFVFISQNGAVYGLPLGDKNILSLTAGQSAQDRGGGLVGIPMSNVNTNGDQVFEEGNPIKLYGLANYGGLYTLTSGTSKTELQFATTFVSETFDGDEFPYIAHEPLSAATSAPIAVDENGVVYYGHTYTNDTYVTKYELDGTATTDFLNTSWPLYDTSHVCLGVALSVAGDYLYLALADTEGATGRNTIQKYNLATGDLVWSTLCTRGFFGLGIDANDNVYSSSGARLDATTGVETLFTWAAQWGPYVDDSLGIVISGAIKQQDGFQLGVSALDGSASDTTTIPGFGQFGNVGVTTLNGYIYALESHIYGPPSVLYKFYWDGASITQVASANGPTYGVAIYTDVYDNLVIINKDASGNADTFYFYDENLTQQGTAIDAPLTMFSTWDSAVGHEWSKGGVVPYPLSSASGTPAQAAVPATTTGTGVNSVAVIPSSSEDEVWVTVTRVINGSEVKYVEQMQPRDWGDDQEDCWFVDSALDYTGVADATFSGLDHLEGEEVYILGEGAVMTPQTVVNGAITLPSAVTRAIVGLPFRYKLKSMRFDLYGDAQGTRGSLRRFAEVVASFYKTLNTEYGVDVNSLFRIDWRTTEAYGTPPELYTGDKILQPEGGFSPEDSLIVTGNDPLPCTVRALIPRIEITGR
jgi:hypothetical protein